MDSLPSNKRKGNCVALSYLFVFKTSLFRFGFYGGQLTVTTYAAGNSILELSLSVSFESQQAFAATYRHIHQHYRKYSYKKIKRPHIAAPYEVFNYVPKTGTDAAVVTKGSSYNQPYINTRYKHQNKGW